MSKKSPYAVCRAGVALDDRLSRLSNVHYARGRDGGIFQFMKSVHQELGQRFMRLTKQAWRDITRRDQVDLLSHDEYEHYIRMAHGSIAELVAAEPAEDLGHPQVLAAVEHVPVQESTVLDEVAASTEDVIEAAGESAGAAGEEAVSAEEATPVEVSAVEEEEQPAEDAEPPAEAAPAAEEAKPAEEAAPEVEHTYRQVCICRKCINL